MLDLPTVFNGLLAARPAEGRIHVGNLDDPGDRAGSLDEVEPVDIARLVRELPDQQLDDLMATRVRGAVLDEVFRRMRRQIRPERSPGTDATIHWRIGGRPGGGDDTYETVIRDGTCTVSSRLTHQPRVTVAMSALTFLKLVTGNVSVPKLFVSRRVKVDGDIGLAVNLASLFDLQKS
ncbi:MAG: SCP2 sterol-binding domain-containing protein [Frankia sp.]